MIVQKKRGLRRGAAGFALAAAAGLGFFEAPVWATNKQWIGPDNSWWDYSSNWNPAGQPQHGDSAFATFSTSGFGATTRTIRYWNTVHPNAVLTLLRLEGLSSSATATGTMVLNHENNHNLRATTFEVGSTASVPQFFLPGGRGIYTQTTGFTQTTHFYLGRGAGSFGTYNITGSNATHEGSWFYVGHEGSGTINHSAGSISVANSLRLGNNTGGSGVYNLSGSGTLSALSMRVGGGGTGTFNQSGGTSSMSSMIVGFGASGAGTYNLSGGTLSLTGVSGLTVGESGTGTFNQTGGTFTTAQTLLGRLSGSSGTATVSGPETVWNNSGNFSVGGRPTGAGGSGSLEVSNQARLNIDQTLYVWPGGEVSVGDTIGTTSAARLTAATLDIRGGSLSQIGGQLIVSTNPDSIFVVGTRIRGGGVVTVTAGGSLTTGSTFIADSGSGEATVSGAGSNWTSSTLSVGSIGTGTLTIEQGGRVETTTISPGLFARLASNSSGNATVLIRDSGSEWSIVGGLNVAGTTSSAGGTADLTISNGGLLSVGNVLRIWDGGEVSLSGSDSRLEASTLEVRGGQLLRGPGTVLDVPVVNITDGGVVINETGRSIGSLSGTGALNVSGSGSTWSNTAPVNNVMSIGTSRGTGTVRIENGGTINSDRVRVGVSEGTGSVTISGEGSLWKNTGASFDIANFEFLPPQGNGDVTVEAGGRLDAGDVLRVWHNGEVTLTDAGSTITAGSLDIRGGQFTRGSGTSLIISDTISSTPSDLQIGRDGGTGTLSIAEGGSLSSPGPASLAVGSGSAGQAGISGAGSSLIVGNLFLGDSGTGTLGIEGGGNVSSTVTWLGYWPSGTGGATVSGAGSRWDTTQLQVGRGGAGTLSIEAGGEVSSTSGIIGNVSGSTGGATVTGLGSAWTMSEWMQVGREGTGTLSVESGGEVLADRLYVAGFSDQAGGTGSVSVADGGAISLTQELHVWNDGAVELSGPSSRITASRLEIVGGQVARAGGSLTISNEVPSAQEFLDIGRGAGTGIMNITEGGRLSNAGAAFIGVQSASTGEVMVSGPGSSWSNDGSITIGTSGSGLLSIEGGGSVSNSFARVGQHVSGSGEVLVTGGGSTWSSTGSLYVGGSATEAGGEGRVTVAAGGTLSVGDVLKVWDRGLVQYDGGTINADDVELSGGGSIVMSEGADVRLSVSRLEIDLAGESFVDLADNELLLVDGEAEHLRGLLFSGHAGGAWDGPGIRSSTAASEAGRALGFAPDRDDMLVKFTWAGDANLDGAVNIGDLTILAANWQQSNRHWYHGDYNYDGIVNIADLAALAGNWQKGATSSGMSFDEALAMFEVFDGVVVPEPGGAGLVLSLAGLLSLRRRRMR